ncbi:hypothetical protein [Sorangium sp. So ce1389]|uniref:hypothetical protein n=1 Tax=Sorangium sp. So ce1389 TaxID=3133336 RepID=UPI003F5ED62E
MTIGLSAMACSADEIKDYIEDNMGEGGGDATSTSSSSQSSTTAGTGGSTTTASTGEGGSTTTAGTGGGTTTASTGEGGGTTSTGEGAGTTSTGEGGGTTTASTGEGGGTTTAGTGGEGGGTTTAGTGGSGSGGAPPVDPACGPDTATFADVRPILEGCANQYCHGNPTGASAAGLDLREAMAVGALVGQDARSCSSEHALVVPFMPSSSYLMNKLNDTGLCDPDESSMPPGSPLPAAQIKTINDWICAGAPAD